MEKKISYLQFQKNYGGKFIARRDSQILAAGKTMKEMFNQMDSKRIHYDESIVISHIPIKGAVCIYVR